MKLFIIATIVAVCSAARLEHLERGYLPPDQAGQGSFGSFGQAQRGFGAASKTSAFGAATSNQYLPPDHEHGAGSGAQGKFGSQQAPNQKYGAPQFGAQSQSSSFGQQNSFGAQGSQDQDANEGSQNEGQDSQNQFGQAPSTQYGAPGQFGAASNGFKASAGGLRGSGSFQPGSQFGAASRQYLAPKTTNNFQNIPQQSFDEETGYHY